MIDKIQNLINKYNNLSEQMSNPDIISDMNKYTKIAREHKSLDIFKLTREILVQEGLYAYEISNHSIKGSESKHNLNVWEYSIPITLFLSFNTM